jgi:two-component system, response regulator RegA
LLIESRSNFAFGLTAELRRLGWNVVQRHDNITGGLAESEAALPSHIILNPSAIRHRYVDSIAGIRQTFPNARLVVLDDRPSPWLAFHAGRLGAAAYLVKPISIPALISVMCERDTVIETVNDCSLDDCVRGFIESTLALCDGNVSRAARLLGIRRQSLQRKLRKIGMTSRW